MSANKWLILNKTINVRIFEIICVPTTVILVCKQISSDSFKKGSPINYWLTNYMYNHLTSSKQISSDSFKKFGWNIVKEETTQKKYYQDEDKKSAINKFKKKFFLKINSPIKKPHLKMIPIKDNHKKFGTDLTMEDQIRIYKTKKSILDRPFGAVDRGVESLRFQVSIVRR